jgi:hypothetical protein
MRRKFGILFLIGITVLAGTQEATRQFDGLKSSLKNFTRASLWSGLIVYAQPVSDGKLPTPQIYYLMPTPQQPQQHVAPAAQQPVLADNGAATTTVKPDARNNHGEEAAVAPSLDALTLAAVREAESAARSELVFNKLPSNLIASHFAAPHAAPHVVPHAVPQPAPPQVIPQPDRVRRYEEVAKNAPLAARKFKQDAEVIAKAFVKEFDDVKLLAETERILTEERQLERLKLKTLGEAANLHRRVELRVLRRPAARPERLERIRVINRLVEPRGVTLPEMSSIGCEKTNVKPELVPAPPAAPLARTSMPLIAEPMVELGLPAASNAGSSWTLNCDTEPEQK